MTNVITISTTALREDLANFLNLAAYGKATIVVTRKDRELARIVPPVSVVWEERKKTLAKLRGVWGKESLAEKEFWRKYHRREKNYMRGLTRGKVR